MAFSVVVTTTKKIENYTTSRDATDTALAHETSRMSLGTWHDSYRGQEQLGA
ncbi:hypothetical protein [Cellulomonas sp. WB94]|uniref:hypothetical protein n=1 Tax=Cellulomonas sp. WB94 TaxID=2173174 RepID=UPI001304A5AE|nr:hypothetical protein [Cellulomonas sp. WB94]